MVVYSMYVAVCIAIVEKQNNYNNYCSSGAFDLSLGYNMRHVALNPQRQKETT